MQNVIVAIGSSTYLLDYITVKSASFQVFLGCFSSGKSGNMTTAGFSYQPGRRVVDSADDALLESREDRTLIIQDGKPKEILRWRQLEDEWG